MGISPPRLLNEDFENAQLWVYSALILAGVGIAPAARLGIGRCFETRMRQVPGDWGRKRGKAVGLAAALTRPCALFQSYALTARRAVKYYGLRSPFVSASQ